MNQLYSIGDLIGISFRTCRRDVKFLISILLVPSIVGLVGKLVSTWGGREYMLLTSKGSSIVSSFESFIPSFCALGFGVVVSYIALFWLLCKQLAYMRKIIYRSDDFEKEFQEVSKHGWKMIGFIFAIIVFFMVWIFVLGFVVGIIGVLMKLTGLPLAIQGLFILLGTFLSILTLFLGMIPGFAYFIVIAMEGDGFFKTIKRSVSLSFRNFGKLTGFGLLIYIVMILVSFCLQGPYQIVWLFQYFKSLAEGGGDYSSSPILAMPLYMQMISVTWQSVIFMYIYPAVILSAGFVYYSIRVKEDGVDLVDDMKRLSGAA